MYTSNTVSCEIESRNRTKLIYGHIVRSFERSIIYRPILQHVTVKNMQRAICVKHEAFKIIMMRAFRFYFTQCIKWDFSGYYFNAIRWYTFSCYVVTDYTAVYLLDHFRQGDTWERRSGHPIVEFSLTGCKNFCFSFRVKEQKMIISVKQMF